MKVKLPLLLLLVLAGALGYLLGTERGRAQRDEVMTKLGRRQSGDEASADLPESAEGDVPAVSPEAQPAGE